ncbi:extracellular solute-binding protein [Paenibacillus sp. NPDC056579]|uniref:extracellular solute-binding protein n=1 Tax=Paenibacillus sp. NPDC056579 TaxID=3345871 RepID=UPI0036BEAD0F
MNKRMKLVTTVVLSIPLILVSACSKSANEPESSANEGIKPTNPSAVESPAPADPMAKYATSITVTSVKAIEDDVQKMINKQADVLTNNIWSRAYENELGIKVKYNWSVPAAQMEEKLNVAISSNDLPDIIPANARQFKMLVDSGVAMDLTQLFEQYATPFTKQMWEEDRGIARSQATVNGKLMALPKLGGAIDAAPILWIRYDWLTKAGLQPPKTMDDVLKIAETFTKSDPDGNGQNDTYGLAFTKKLYERDLADLSGFFGGYHAYPNGWIKGDSGQLVYGGIQPQVKTALSKLAEMYKNGYIDKEFSVKDGTKVAESLVSGKIGMFFGPHYVPFYPLQDGKNKDPKADWRAYPLVSADDKPAVPMIHGSVPTTGVYFVVNKNMKNPEAVIKLYNYHYAKEIPMSKDFDPKFHGINGEQETHPDQHYKWSVLGGSYPAQNILIHDGVKKYFDTKDESLLNNFWIKDNMTQIQKYMDGDNKLWSAYVWSGPKDSAFSVISGYYASNNFIVNGYIKADTDSMTKKGATLKQMQDETFTKIIMGSNPADEFDQFVAKWKKLGGDDITKEVNAVK